ncbi:MAG: alpha-amylase [Saprospiraceae bacterium]|nr:alpha-amylase [Saprospiraceae bacterium]
MYKQDLYKILSEKMDQWLPEIKDSYSREFIFRYAANLNSIHTLFDQIYGHRNDATIWFEKLLDTIFLANRDRSDVLKNLDFEKSGGKAWFLTNEIAGMSLYVDRFCGSIKNLEDKLTYFDELGVNFLHLMPVMESPEGESDGGYAVSDFRSVDPRFGCLDDLLAINDKMKEKNMYLMLDIVINHTSSHHEWAIKASAGDKDFQDYYFMYDSREMPDEFEKNMPDIFPESSPGSFTFDAPSGKWVMTVFNRYQWDLNYTNPAVFVDMLDTIFFYANLGVDILRIDAPAFIWKQPGTSCQNLPEAHVLLQLIKYCTQISSPGMALLGEAIVAPKEIMKYFGTGQYKGRECDVAYNATQMALQWDALATGDTRIMLAAQHDIGQKPFGTTWITYTRCHDDIGLGYEDAMIQQSGFNPYEHRTFIKNYYSGQFDGSPAKGALFGVNPKTGDARISGSLASLCGLEKALEAKSPTLISASIDKILLMQAQSILLGGIPMLYYGDECGYTNDYSYLLEDGKSYDNRWMHRPVIDWKKNSKRKRKDTIERIIFASTARLIQIRKQYQAFGDYSNIEWIGPYNIHIAGYVRYYGDEKLVCLFNFSESEAFLTWYAIREKGFDHSQALIDIWGSVTYQIDSDDRYLVLKPYQFMILTSQ